MQADSMVLVVRRLVGAMEAFVEIQGYSGQQGTFRVRVEVEVELVIVDIKLRLSKEVPYSVRIHVPDLEGEDRLIDSLENWDLKARLMPDRAGSIGLNRSSCKRHPVKFGHNEGV